MQVAKTKRDKWCYALYCVLWGLLLAFVIAMTVAAARLEWKEIKRLTNGTIPAYAGDSGPVVTAGAGEVPEEGEDMVEGTIDTDCRCGRCGDG